MVMMSVAEYGGKWKMLHYFAKKFFRAKILSAYIESDNVSVYYVNDDIDRRTRQFDSRQTKHGQFDGSLNDISLNSISVLEYHLKPSDDVTQPVDNCSHTSPDCTVVLQCFWWSSFEPHAQWNITFPQVYA